MEMSRKLINWSLFYSVFCLIGTAVTIWMQSRGPIVVAAMISFGWLLYIYRSGNYTHRLLQGANLLTLGRLLLTLALFSLPLLPNAGMLIVSLSILILIADGFDGWIARKRNQETEFGEYFDKETDAFFLLTLCVLAYWQDKVGAWILIPGLLRYVFVVAMAITKPQLGKEYRSGWARVIFVVMISSLLGVFVLPAWIYAPAITLATTALILSFAHYFIWILSERFKGRTLSSIQTWFFAIGGFLFLNALLLLPSFITNLGTSSFFPVPGSNDPMETSHWTRGWYDYVLYFTIRRPNQDLFRICVDLVALLSLFYAAHYSKLRTSHLALRTKQFIIPAFIGLLLYEVYDALVYSFFHRPGIFLEDGQYWLNLYYIFRDAVSPEQAPVFISAVVGFVLLLWALPSLFKLVTHPLKAIKQRFILPAFSILFWAVALFFWFWFGAGNSDPTFRSVIGKIGNNFSDSIDMHQTMKANRALPVDSVYTSYASINLADKPDIYLILIESYGSILQESPNLRARFELLANRINASLNQAGWYSASKESKAPVSGGLSWLSMSSVLSGMYIDNKSQHTAFLDRIDAYPHLVQFLNNQGYYTITLQPPNRERPGLPIENPFRFDQTVFYKELGYTGTPYGVWIIPDQYSFEFTFENYIAPSARPSFLFFETASTHAPWVTPPPLVKDWRTLNENTAQPEPDQATSSVIRRVGNSFNNRFNRQVPDTFDQYFQSISYDIDVITRYILTRADPGSLFIILGDHQPPLLKSTTYNTPMHVISRDSSFINKLDAFDFTPGLSPSPPYPRTTHASIYSMLIDLLTISPDSSHLLPTADYRPNGIPPSFIH